VKNSPYEDKASDALEKLEAFPPVFAEARLERRPPKFSFLAAGK
jgi:hypothetical protein